MAAEAPTRQLLRLKARQEIGSIAVAKTKHAPKRDRRRRLSEQTPESVADSPKWVVVTFTKEPSWAPLDFPGASSWPRHIGSNESFDAYERRLAAHCELMRKRGGFRLEEAAQAVISTNPEDKQAVARWLRGELKKLREAETGSAPVRRGKSRLIIADLAMTMTESLECLGEDLVGLLRQLLDVDRHRKALAEIRSEKFETAVSILAEGYLKGQKYGIRKLAKMVSTSPSTVKAWRQSPMFRKAFEHKTWLWDQILRKDYFADIKAQNPNISDQEAFSRAFDMYFDDRRKKGLKDEDPMD
jgi:hypothetical protein